MSKRQDFKNAARYNHQITNDEIRLIDSSGNMKGVVNTKEAIALAKQENADLVEISPTADPPVCKITDYGKYVYEQKKRLSEAKKKSKTTTLKEVKFRPNIGENDFQTKVRSLKKFALAKHKIKVSLQFRGREITHKEVGMNIFKRIIEMIKDFAKVESDPKFEGRQIIMFLSPL